VDPTRGRAGNLDFVKFFLEPAAVTGWKFDSGQQNRRRREVRLMLDRNGIFALEFKASPRRRRVMKKHRFQQKGHISQTGNCAAINLKTFRPFEFAINQRDIELKSEAAVDLVTGHNLRDRTVFILSGRICDFVSIHLNGRKTGELLADRRVPSGQPGKKWVDSIPGMALSCGV